MTTNQKFTVEIDGETVKFQVVQISGDEVLGYSQEYGQEMFDTSEVKFVHEAYICKRCGRTPGDGATFTTLRSSGICDDCI